MRLQQALTSINNIITKLHPFASSSLALALWYHFNDFWISLIELDIHAANTIPNSICFPHFFPPFLSKYWMWSSSHLCKYVYPHVLAVSKLYIFFSSRFQPAKEKEKNRLLKIKAAAKKGGKWGKNAHICTKSKSSRHLDTKLQESNRRTRKKWRSQHVFDF